MEKYIIQMKWLKKHYKIKSTSKFRFTGALLYNYLSHKLMEKEFAQLMYKKQEQNFAKTIENDFRL